MRQNRLWWFGFGFAAFGLGTNTGLRIATMPVIGWQPSQQTAEILLGLSFFVALFGLSLMAYTAIPENLALKSLPVRVFVSRNRTVLLTWLLGASVFAFMAWQSITIYQFQTEQASKEWTPLTPHQISQWGKTLSRCHPNTLIVYFADSHSESFRSSLDEVFKNAHWPQAGAVGVGNAIGIQIRARSDESGATTLVKLLNGAGYTAALDPGETRVGFIQIYIGHKPPS